MPESHRKGAGGDRGNRIPAPLEGPCRTVDALTESRQPFDGGGENVRILGDIGPGGKVRNAAAVVVDGQVDGVEINPCRIESRGAVVVQGTARFAHIRAREIYLGKGARTCVLSAVTHVRANGDLIGCDVEVGDGDRRSHLVDNLRHAIARAQEQADAIGQQILQEKRRLDGVINATGIVFNLNIGQIVRQEPGGLRIDLQPFYGALPNRSEEEIDRALKEFFARAVLGLLTRMNREYISAGPGHRKRFATVVQRLQELVMLTRQCDKCGRLVRRHRDQFQVAISQSETETPQVLIAGVILPETHISVSALLVNTDENGEFEVSVKRDGVTVREGKGRNRDEMVVWRDGEVIDLVFVPPDSLHHVVFQAEGDRIAWRDIDEDTSGAA